MSRVLRILETVTTRGRDRICEACGSEFTCGVSLKGCWCAEIQLTEEVRKQLRSQYSDCLCRQCLEDWSNGRLKRGAKGKGERLSS